MIIGMIGNLLKNTMCSFSVLFPIKYIFMYVKCCLPMGAENKVYKNVHYIYYFDCIYEIKI